MNLIIIDDEKLMVKSIKEHYDWSSLQIDQVFTAYDINSAKEIFDKEQMNIMLCDIEMPGGNGIELYRWVKENHPNVLNIFLTCHADFKYAKEALSLGSFEYILKPIPYSDLEVTIKKAVEQVHVWQKVEDLTSHGKQWLTNEKRLIEQFWQDVLLGKISGERKDLVAIAELRKLSLEIPDEFELILLNLFKLGSEFERWDPVLQEFTIKNIFTEMFIGNRRGYLISIGKGRYAALMHDSEGIRQKEMDAIYEKFSNYLQETFDIQVFGLLGNDIGLSELSVTIKLMLKIEGNMVLYEAKMLHLSGIDDNAVEYISPNLTLWNELVFHNEPDRLKEEVKRYMEGLGARRAVNSDILNLLYHDVIHILYGYLANRGIDGASLLKDQSFKASYSEATGSMKYMEVWLDELIDKTFVYADMVDEKKEIVDRITDYIDHHIAEEINREQLAVLVYLNPSYMARLFKKGTGQSLTDYITDVRMNRAKEYLTQTSMSISEIAVKTGYPNFSYFSRVFKKYYEVSPSEMRAQ